jgi:hypothetical protein
VCPQVQRLLRIYQYAQRYEADWEVAWANAERQAAELRKAEPSGADDDAAGARGRCTCTRRQGGTTAAAAAAADLLCYLLPGHRCCCMGPSNNAVSFTASSGLPIFTFPLDCTFSCRIAAKRGKRKAPKVVRMEVEDDDDLGGMPGGLGRGGMYGRDKRKRKVCMPSPLPLVV